jgi:hypothetical protein
VRPDPARIFHFHVLGASQQRAIGSVEGAWMRSYGVDSVTSSRSTPFVRQRLMSSRQAR